MLIRKHTENLFSFYFMVIPASLSEKNAKRGGDKVAIFTTNVSPEH
jgi:hypothetical protein